MTGGQGGLVWSGAKDVVAAVRDYRQFDAREVYAPRFNFQMTDIQAALAASQMQRLGEIRARRAEIAQAYLRALPSGLSVQAGLDKKGRTVHRFVVCAPDREVRDALRASLADAEVAASCRWSERSCCIAACGSTRKPTRLRSGSPRRRCPCPYTWR